MGAGAQGGQSSIIAVGALNNLPLSTAQGREAALKIPNWHSGDNAQNDQQTRLHRAHDHWLEGGSRVKQAEAVSIELHSAHRREIRAGTTQLPMVKVTGVDKSGSIRSMKETATIHVNVGPEVFTSDGRSWRKIIRPTGPTANPGKPGLLKARKRNEVEGTDNATTVELNSTKAQVGTDHRHGGGQGGKETGEIGGTAPKL